MPALYYVSQDKIHTTTITFETK